MVQKGLPGAAEQTGKLRPGVRGGHVDDPHGLDPGFGRFNTKEARGLATLDTTPELAFGGNDQVLIERIGMGGDLDPFAAAGMRKSDFALRLQPSLLREARNWPNRKAWLSIS
jgi:hypothetical protein